MTTNNNTPFHSFPNKYPKARQKAKELMASMHELNKKGPRTLIATIVDVTFHLTQGYCTCTTELGIIRVYGIPYGSVVANMRVYARQMGGHATTRDHIFDGFAQNPSRTGQSGSLTYDVPMTVSASSTPLAVSPSGSLTASSSLTSSVGYYWHCFFYLPSLPQGGNAVLMQMAGPSSYTLTLSLAPTGILSILSNDGNGFSTVMPVAPHSVHWFVLQPGLVSSYLMLDGVAPTIVGTAPTFAGGTNTYRMSLLASVNGGTGISIPPLGSWVSKVGYGVAYSGGSPVALPVSVPVYDTQIVTTTGNGITPKGVYLCGDVSTSSTLANSGSDGSGASMTVNTTNATIQTLGPY